jgi:DNA mismatch endonuclease (patch repair protein)
LAFTSDAWEVPGDKMADVISIQARSRLMAKVRSHGNKSTELKLIKIFKTNGITGWRRKQALIGKPDFVFKQDRVCVFVDGCFWHGCDKCYRAPKSNQEFWLTKFEKNRARDRLVNRTLKTAGWRVLRIWEHQLGEKVRKRLLARFRHYFRHG